MLKRRNIKKLSNKKNKIKEIVLKDKIKKKNSSSTMSSNKTSGLKLKKEKNKFRNFSILKRLH